MKIQKLQLNTGLDVGTLADDFNKRKRIRIENILNTHSAEATLDCLKNYTAWEQVYTDPESGPIRLNHQQLEKMTVEELKSIHAKVFSQATTHYQYIYKFFPMVDAITDGRVTEKSMLNEIATFLNSADFIGLARQITGDNSLVKIDPQATLYEPGHFKNLHDDMRVDNSARDRSSRRFAVVLDLTKNWSVNWGGDTQFFAGPNQTQCEAWFPSFNTMTIFQVPALHRTAMVAPYAGKGRYTITGWLRDDPDIIRLDLGDKTSDHNQTDSHE